MCSQKGGRVDDNRMYIGRRGVGMLAALLVLMGTGVCIGDVLLKSDGTQLKGHVVASDDKTLTFETHFEGMLVRQKVSREDVKQIVKELHEGPGYCLLPMQGEIGVEVTADELQKAIAIALPEKPAYIVLLIDSPVGSIQEMQKVLQVMSDTHGVTFVAYAQRAMSAAAIIAMACPEIYLPAKGTIGAAVPFKLDEKGLPVDVEQKFLSAIRAVMRGAAEMGGHSPLLAQGMSDLNVELVLREHAGKIAVEEAQQGRELKGDEIIKPPGKILTMTATEAAHIGLSAGTVEKIDDIRLKKGLKAWYKTSDEPSFYLKNHATAARTEFAEKSTKARLKDITDRLDQCAATRTELEAKAAALEAGFKEEMNAVKAEYDKAMNEVHPIKELDKYRQITETRKSQKTSEIQARYKKLYDETSQALRDVLGQEAVLKAMANELEKP